jgi:hypothetical protein
VRLEQAGQHRRYLLGTVWSPRYPGDLGDVPRVAGRDPTERLYPLGQLVNEGELLAGVLVEDLGVGEDPVQRLARALAGLGRQRYRKLPYGAERLDLFAVLVQPWLAIGCLC